MCSMAPVTVGWILDLSSGTQNSIGVITSSFHTLIRGPVVCCRLCRRWEDDSEAKHRSCLPGVYISAQVLFLIGDWGHGFCWSFLQRNCFFGPPLWNCLWNDGVCCGQCAAGHWFFIFYAWGWLRGFLMCPYLAEMEDQVEGRHRMTFQTAARCWGLPGGHGTIVCSSA